MTVNGGEFYKFNPAENYADPDSPANFVSEGYTSVKSGDWYKVVESAK